MSGEDRPRPSEGRPPVRRPRRAQRPATGGAAAPSHGSAPAGSGGEAVSADDTDLGWGGSGEARAADGDDAHYLRDVPPHWG